MGIVKEPQEIDFTVINRSLSEKEQEKISEYIRKDKKKRGIKKQAVTEADETASILVKLLNNELHLDWDSVKSSLKQTQMLDSLLPEEAPAGIGRILTCHLVLENYIIKYLERDFPAKAKNINNLNFKQKVQKLPEQRIEVSLLMPAMLELNKVRNKLAHNIEAIIEKDDLIEIGKVLSMARHNKRYAEPIAMIEDFVVAALVFLSTNDSGMKEIVDNRDIRCTSK